MSEKSLGDQSNEKKVNISNEDEIEKELEAAAQLKKMELNVWFFQYITFDELLIFLAEKFEK